MPDVGGAQPVRLGVRSLFGALAERPWAFDMLPFEEQQWRARVFLSVWVNTGSTIFAWAQALRKEPDDAEVRAWVLRNMTDEVIIEGLRSVQQATAGV